MSAGESRTVIKRMQEFMDNLDRHVLNQKVLGNVKVKHLAAAFLAYKALQGMGKVENAETTGQIYAGGLQAIASMGGRYTGTVVNRYDRDGKIVDSVPVYQVKEAAKSQMRKVAKNVQNMFMNAKKQNG